MADNTFRPTWATPSIEFAILPPAPEIASVEHQTGSPVDTGIVAELGQHDRSIRTGGECILLIIAADNIGQSITGLRDAAADNDDLRIRYSREHAERRSEIFGKFIDNAGSDSIARFIRVEYSPGIEVLFIFKDRSFRGILRGKHAVGRVIARPFIGEPSSFTRTSRRHDFSLEPPSETVLDMLKAAGYEVAAYSGYTLEQLLQGTDGQKELLGTLDVLIDGPFLQAERSLELNFRGSRNQRVLNVPESLKAGTQAGGGTGQQAAQSASWAIEMTCSFATFSRVSTTFLS